MNELLDQLPEFLQNEIVLFAIVVAVIAIVGYVVLWLFREIRGDPAPPPASQASPRMPESPQGDVLGVGSAGPTRTLDLTGSGVLGTMSQTSRIMEGPVSGMLPRADTSIEGRDRIQIEPELRQAGYYRPTALAEYKSVRALLIVVPLVVAAALALVVDNSQVPTIALGGLVVAALGYSIPRVYINMVARARRREIERGLPVAVDMIVLGLLAGQNVMKSFQRVAFEVRRAFPILSEEMQLTYRQAELNTLGHALRVWAKRSYVPEVYNLAIILTQSEQQGADITNGLFEFSSNFRVTLRQRADAQANRASFWMLFPTVFCMWIPAAVVLAAPVYFEFDERRAKARDALVPPGGDPSESLQKRYAPFMKAKSQMPAQ
jgi:pilus assembly protein TadC